MVKVAYNACYGGFSLSDEAVKLAREMSGNPKWGGIVMKNEQYENGEICNFDWGSHHIDSSTPRHDPILIAVIEALGARANGRHARISVEEVPGPYRIYEYDGLESVKTPDGYDLVYPEPPQ